MMDYSVIDVARWKRKEHFLFYRDFDNPTWDLLADIRITGFYQAIRAADHPFFLSFLYVIARAANAIPEFRLRISEEGEVREYATVHPGSTLLTDDGTFQFGYFQYGPSFSQFVAGGRHVMERARQDPGFDPRGDDLARLYCTPVPWVSFRGFRHPFRRATSNSIPMIIFGKHELREGERTIPVGVTLHHGLADGYHAGQFFAVLQALLDDPASFLGS